MQFLSPTMLRLTTNEELYLTQESCYLADVARLSARRTPMLGTRDTIRPGGLGLILGRGLGVTFPCPHFGPWQTLNAAPGSPEVDHDPEDPDRAPTPWEIWRCAWKGKPWRRRLHHPAPSAPPPNLDDPVPELPPLRDPFPDPPGPTFPRLRDLPDLPPRPVPAGGGPSDWIENPAWLTTTRDWDGEKQSWPPKSPFPWCIMPVSEGMTKQFMHEEPEVNPQKFPGLWNLTVQGAHGKVKQYRDELWVAYCVPSPCHSPCRCYVNVRLIRQGALPNGAPPNRKLETRYVWYVEVRFHVYCR
jgi:hypothetical protein